ncbi:transmembrane protein 39A-like isoform X2 [Littorina saxatilis]|uniref:transmembrane protein 39A-like isoform X2 n=1 Tax=Littorina saxatilis TaxID=31220 RepID=UPI0038B65B11
MPGGRRTFSRIQPGSSYPSSAKSGGSSGSHAGDEREPNLIPLASMVVLPKHVVLPEIPMDGNVHFEIILYMLGLVVMGLQYVNLYKTVWWLPHSHANYALNFYLIDPYLVSFLAIIMSRRLIICFLQEILVTSATKGVRYWVLLLLRVMVTVTMVVLLGYTGYYVITQHSPLYSLFLCYPLATYLILFGLTVKPLYTRYQAWPRPVASVERQHLKYRSSPREGHQHTAATTAMVYNIDKDPVLFHSCTLTPDVVREEVEMLKTDFNDRMKQVLFNSMLSAYYMAFVPLCFAQNTLYYDTWWVGQHVCLTWLSTFLMLVTHFLSPRYLDLLHRSALHLGRWQRVEGRHVHVPYSAWSELQVWPQGALVKHVRGLFKADGVNVTAEPGNSMHARFYFLFHQPLHVMSWLLGLAGILVFYQFFRLAQSIQWSHVLCLALMLFCNFYTVFKLLRDFFIMSKTYRDHDPAANTQ